MRPAEVFRVCPVLFIFVPGIFSISNLPAQSPAFIRGDVNLDGQVTVADASYLLDFRFLGGPAPRCFDAADVLDNGQLDTVGIGEAGPLLDWLFRTLPAPVLPPPFPQPGVDPTPDGLGCANSTIMPPVDATKRMTFAWNALPTLARRARDVPIFVLATTTAPIECFSIAYRVDRKVLANVQVDLEGTVFPTKLRAQFESSPLFRFAVVPSADPDFDLLLAGAVFIGDSGAGIDFAATQGPLRGARLLRVVADVRADAPLGPRTLFLPARDEDLLVSGRYVHGVKNEFVVLGGSSPGQSSLPLAQASDPSILVDAEEFLRSDSNSDMKIDISDALTTLTYLFLGGIDLHCPDGLDANDDGSLDISDASFTLGYLFLGQNAPPPPGPAGCGFDPTLDLLPPCLQGCF